MARVQKTDRSPGEEMAEKPAGVDGGKQWVEEAGPWFPDVALQMRCLEDVQLDRNTMNAQANHAFLKLEDKYG